MYKKFTIKFIWKGKGTRITKTFLEKNEVGEIILQDD